MDYKKKLHINHPEKPSVKIDTHKSKSVIVQRSSDSRDIERDVRQQLACKVSGNLIGLWLLIPEHLRLGTWDIIKCWTGASRDSIEPRMALQLINESALCVNSTFRRSKLGLKGFELASGLPFIAADPPIHQLLNKQSVSDSIQLQVVLGKIRRSLGHFNGTLLAIDPHRLKSSSKRQMVKRCINRSSKPCKMAQTFFCIDAETEEPICFTSATSSRTATQATAELLTYADQILNINVSEIGLNPLVMADTEHYGMQLLDWVKCSSPFDILLPMPNKKSVMNPIYDIPEERFQRHWAGYATTKLPFRFKDSAGNRSDEYFQFIQRKGERKDDYAFKPFLCTSDRNELTDLTENYPARWHIEEFFNKYQALGWKKPGTMNLNIQYGKMTMALFAQAATSMIRKKLPPEMSQWNAETFAKNILAGFEGDIRVKHDTIVVTYYNATLPEDTKRQFTNLPRKLICEGINPKIPWLFDYKLDFIFR